MKCSNTTVFIIGPTASGKTSFAVALARALQSEIISADSRQVYRGMDIGTGKDLAEYDTVPYHMIDVCDAGYKYNLYEYLRDFHKVHDALLAKGLSPVVCGGTGLYVESVLKGVCLPEVPADNELRSLLCGRSLAELSDMLGAMKRLHNTTDVDTVQRAIRAIEIEAYYAKHPEQAQRALNPEPMTNALTVALDIPRQVRRERITSRLRSRLDGGMLDEVQRLLDSGIAAEDLIYYGLEYKYLTMHLLGKISYDQMFSELEIAIHQFAKRQLTWFRGMERRGFKLHWLPFDMSKPEFVDRVLSLMPG